MTADPIVVTLILGALGSGGIGAVVSAWIMKRPDPVLRENSLIDQLQEMLEAGRVREVESKREARESQRREASLLNYVWTLQRHINSGQPPPPPQWPDDLIAR